MKESKMASFDGLSFVANFDEGALVQLSVVTTGRDVIGAKETQELYHWLATAVLPTSAPSVPVGIGLFHNEPSKAAPSVQTNDGKITDAQSVARRKPIAEQLASEGMVLEDRPVNIPVQVPGGKR